MDHSPTHLPQRLNLGQTPDQRLLSPFPFEADRSVHDFCVGYGIGTGLEGCLDKLGFQIRDNLIEVTENQWKEAGFKPLEWQHVLKAYKKYKVDKRQD